MNFASYRSESTHRFALSRFVVPAARLEQFEAALPAGIDDPWRVSALLTGTLEADLRAVADFNARLLGRAIVDAVEFKAHTPAQIEEAAKLLPPGLTANYEIPVDNDPSELIAAIAVGHHRAKIRTGGVTPDAFPKGTEILRFLELCARADVAFKATAGLHHPLFSHRALTYADGGPTGWMFGFLNVFLAASWIRLGVDPKALLPLLEEQDARSFTITEQQICWNGYRLTAAKLEQVRSGFAISFGSCSFEEPIADLQALHWLDAE